MAKVGRPSKGASAKRTRMQAATEVLKKQRARQQTGEGKADNTAMTAKDPPSYNPTSSTREGQTPSSSSSSSSSSSDANDDACESARRCCWQQPYPHPRQRGAA